MKFEDNSVQGFIGRYQERVMELRNNCLLAVHRSFLGLAKKGKARSEHNLGMMVKGARQGSKSKQ